MPEPSPAMLAELKRLSAEARPIHNCFNEAAAQRDLRILLMDHADALISAAEERDDLRSQLSEVRATLAVETSRLNCLFDNHATDEFLANVLASDYLDSDNVDEDEIAEIRRAWRQAIDAEMRKTDTDASDLHGCDPIREGSKETPEWENNPR